jgi:hypothetical protein
LWGNDENDLTGHLRHCASMSDDLKEPVKTIITETTSKRVEGENASLSFAGSKHVTKWLMAVFGALLLNLGHGILDDVLPAKGEAQRQEVKEQNALAVGRNDSDNTYIKDKLDKIASMGTDVETMKSDMRDLKEQMNVLNGRIDDILLKK